MNTNIMETKLEVTNLITPLLELLKMTKDEWDNFNAIGLAEYLQSQTEKYYSTNTFLHRNEKVKFYDVYFPISVKYNHLKTTFGRPQETFENYKCISILGMAGSGKSTLVKYIFLKTISEKFRIPLMVELRQFNDFSGSFSDFILEKIANKKIKPSDLIVERSLKSGKFLIILDGYDEVLSSKKQLVNSGLDAFIDSYPSNSYLVTSRPGAGLENTNRFHQFEVCALEKKEIISFINKMVSDAERRERMIKIVTSPENNSYLHYLKNPLLLSMFILAFESHPEVPKRKSAFYRNVFDTLYSKHDGITKQSFPREKQTGLQREEFERILELFSYLTIFKGKYSFTEGVMNDIFAKIKEKTEFKFDTEKLVNDLTTAISILVREGFEYKFPHKSLQEYFLAVFISKLETEKKEIVYSNMLGFTHNKYDTDRSLWELCREVDEIAFQTYYTLPFLRAILKRFDNKDEIGQIEEMCGLMEYVVDINIQKNDIFLLSLIKLESSFLTFCGLDSVALFDFVNELQVRTKLFNLLKEKYLDTKDLIYITPNPIGNSSFWGTQWFEVLREAGFYPVVQKTLNSIRNYIIGTEKGLQKKESSLDDLLKL
jgi:hypothetical protein